MEVVMCSVFPLVVCFFKSIILGTAAIAVAGLIGALAYTLACWVTSLID